MVTVSSRHRTAGPWTLRFVTVLHGNSKVSNRAVRRGGTLAVVISLRSLVLSRFLHRPRIRHVIRRRG
jgi:hypothetical protein